MLVLYAPYFEKFECVKRPQSVCPDFSPTLVLFCSLERQLQKFLLFGGCKKQLQIAVRLYKIEKQAIKKLFMGQQFSKAGQD